MLRNLLYKLLNPFVSVFAYLLTLTMPYSWIDTMYSYEFTSDFTIRKRITDFDKVLEFNRLFSVPQVSVKKSKSENLKVIHNGYALITEEFQELKDAIKERDIIEVKDALCDLVYVIYGLLYRINMTSNAKLNTIAANFTYNSANMFNPYHNLYKIINANTLLNKYTYIEVYDNVNRKMNFDIRHQTIDKSFDNLVNDVFEMYNNMDNLSHMEYLITNIDKHISMYDKLSYEYVENMLIYSLIDLLLFVYQVGELTFDFRSNFDIVHRSNMSKICSSEEEAIATVESYEQRYARGSVSYDSPYYEKIADDKWMVRNRSTQKVLKNINYKPVEEFAGWLE
jgi:predicted HAD superfamily Cof-like phosphohydrolase